MSEPGGIQQGRFIAKPTAESHFSWLRTRLSVERTLMSWVRTAVSLIGFGFTIFQILERDNVHVREAWYLGLAMIGAGTAAMIIATWQYRWVVKYLWSKPFKEIAGLKDVPGYTPLFVVAVLLTVVGCFAFIAVSIKFR